MIINTDHRMKLMWLRLMWLWRMGMYETMYILASDYYLKELHLKKL